MFLAQKETRGCRIKMKTRPKTNRSPTGVRTDFIVCIHFLTYHQYTHLKSDTTAATDSAEGPVYALASLHGLNRAATVTVHGGVATHDTGQLAVSPKLAVMITEQRSKLFSPRFRNLKIYT